MTEQDRRREPRSRLDGNVQAVRASAQGAKTPVQEAPVQQEARGVPSRGRMPARVPGRVLPAGKGTPRTGLRRDPRDPGRDPGREPGREPNAASAKAAVTAPAKPARPAKSPVPPSVPPVGKPPAGKPASPSPARATVRPGSTAKAEPAQQPVPQPGARGQGRRRPPRAPFVLLVVGLLGGGLVSLLLLNTVLAQDSFKYNELRRITEQLHQQADSEHNRIREALQPTSLASRAAEVGLVADDSAPEFVGDGVHPASLGERLREPGARPSAGASATPKVTNTESTTEGSER
ncbi:hypothetical protein [Acrocarpospora catenulata]|uniref:hypothetical protein n=1 Tax=Acrocarpospora catenulata TaxID=2836182 RepID=UPI001BDA3718|nr:hypothetical protein [Acrocarpospora catenulata]